MSDENTQYRYVKFILKGEGSFCSSKWYIITCALFRKLANTGVLLQNDNFFKKTRILLYAVLEGLFYNNERIRLSMHVSYLCRKTIPPIKKINRTFFMQNLTSFHFVLSYFSRMTHRKRDIYQKRNSFPKSKGHCF